MTDRTKGNLIGPTVVLILLCVGVFSVFNAVRQGVTLERQLGVASERVRICQALYDRLMAEQYESVSDLKWTRDLICKPTTELMPK